MRIALALFLCLASILSADKPLVLILLGPPASGKGTQAVVLKEDLHIPHISTGDLLRGNIREGTDLGKQAKAYLDAGQLVPDELVLDMLFARIAQSDAQNGYILDGFPRTIAQADAYGCHVKENINLYVINLDVSDATVLARIQKRAREQNRSDDTPEIAQARLAVYREQTAPLIAYYQKAGVLYSVDGNRDRPEEVTKEILQIIVSKAA